ncbi:MAG TPA: hypothetical protein VKE74_24190, partial [Gemmataceae bacterium]|nr:hypothetical protein [Gemmataceae bacterium]
MPTRRLALLALCLLLVGCTRYSSRAQGPFAKKAPAVQPGGLASTTAAPRSPLAMAGVNDPAPPAPPGDLP